MLRLFHVFKFSFDFTELKLEIIDNNNGKHLVLPLYEAHSSKQYAYIDLFDLPKEPIREVLRRPF